MEETPVGGQEQQADTSAQPQVKNYGISKAQETDLEKRFTYHPPKAGLGQGARYVILRRMALEFAKMITMYCPDSREKSLALTKLEEVSMWGNAAIARNE